VREVNAARTSRVLGQLASRITLAGARVAVLGMAFKPGTDDLRESRSLELARRLHEAGAEVRIWDPMAGAQAASLLGHAAAVAPDLDAALTGADAAVVATAWPEIVALDPARVRSQMRRALVLDGRRALDPAAWRAHCEYLPIGIMA
jgi:UDPglucose 6-dehydrogenase